MDGKYVGEVDELKLGAELGLSDGTANAQVKQHIRRTES